MTFGEKLTTLRKQHGLSQEDLAEKLSVSRQAISRWEADSTSQMRKTCCRSVNCLVFPSTTSSMMTMKAKTIHRLLLKSSRKWSCLGS